MTPWDDLADALEAEREAARTGDEVGEYHAAEAAENAREQMVCLAHALLALLAERVGIPDALVEVLDRGWKPVLEKIERLEAAIGRVSDGRGEVQRLRDENWDLAQALVRLTDRVEELERRNAQDESTPERHGQAVGAKAG